MLKIFKISKEYNFHRRTEHYLHVGVLSEILNCINYTSRNNNERENSILQNLILNLMGKFYGNYQLKLSKEARK